MKKLNLLIFTLISIVVWGCSSSDDNGGNDPIPPNADTPYISISPKKNTDEDFETGIQGGLFVAIHEADGDGELKTDGNYADNIQYTYTGGQWNPSTPMQYPDGKTQVDMHFYSPYAESNNATVIAVKVANDQSNEADYIASDFYAGTKKAVYPNHIPIEINTTYKTCHFQITIKPGEGFTSEQFEQAEISIRVNNIRTQAKYNLATSQMTPIGEPASVILQKTNFSYTYRGIIPPQTVEECNLITVIVDGKEYDVTGNFKFNAGVTQVYPTLTLNKSQSQMEITVGQWDDDGTDNGGVAK